MPPQQTTSSSSRVNGAGKGNRATTTNASRKGSAPTPTTDERQDDSLDEDEDMYKSIPAELLTLLLHEFFAKDGTRITKDANAAVAKYMDVFIREAIARSAAERDGGGFLEVEDLEKIAPQLLLDM